MQPIPLEQLFAFLLKPDVATTAFSSLLKAMFLVAFGLYIAFAVLVVRQVQLMTKTYHTGAEFTLAVLAASHLILAVVCFGIVLLIL